MFLQGETLFEVPSCMQIIDRTYYPDEQVKRHVGGGRHSENGTKGHGAMEPLFKPCRLAYLTA